MPTLCAHCGSEVRGAQLAHGERGGAAFCCIGCQTVYAILNAGGLTQFYDLRRRTAEPGAIKPVAISSETYRYLDDPEFKARYARQDGTVMDFYLEGVSCAACLWLVEKLPVLVKDEVAGATLELGRSVAHIRILPGGRFAPAAKMLEELGYRPHPIEHDEESERLRKEENRAWLVQIGVAGACAGNIMLLSIPLYSGLEGALASGFRWLSFALFLPVAAYAALPFYRSAWASLRTWTMSIDVPIVLALAFGSASSFWHLLSGSEHIYFDSLSALVFLLLASRYVLRRVQQNALLSSHLFQFLSPSSARRRDPATGAETEVSVAALRIGDLVAIRSSDVLPVDGTVRGGSGAINCALLTGESAPRVAGPGDSVYSGTVLDGGELEVEVTALGARTRLGRILEQIEKGSLGKARIAASADRVARWFLGAVLLAAAATVFLAPSLAEGFSRALALVIVTCPCALALATPLALSVALSRAARQGILVKGGDVLEKVSQARNIVLDKTGTVTRGRFEVVDFPKGPKVDALLEAISALESRSKHPVARAIQEAIAPRLTGPTPEVSGFTERLGAGVEGVINDRRLALHAMTNGEDTAVGIYDKGELAGVIRLGDAPRSDSAECVTRLERLGLACHLLSGDNAGALRRAALAVGIPTGRTLASASPESKQRFVSDLDRALMVGDGANDALALSSAFVGVAVHGSMEVSLRAADVYLTRPGLAPVVQLVRIARETMRVIDRNFAFSLLYNLAGGIAAATGHVSPLFAAILMPLSAFTVFGSSLLGGRAGREGA